MAKKSKEKSTIVPETENVLFIESMFQLSEEDREIMRERFRSYDFSEAFPDLNFTIEHTPQLETLQEERFAMPEDASFGVKLIINKKSFREWVWGMSLATVKLNELLFLISRRMEDGGNVDIEGMAESAAVQAIDYINRRLPMLVNNLILQLSGELQVRSDEFLMRGMSLDEDSLKKFKLTTSEMDNLAKTASRATRDWDGIREARGRKPKPEPSEQEKKDFAEKVVSAIRGFSKPPSLGQIAIKLNMSGNTVRSQTKALERELERLNLSIEDLHYEARQPLRQN